MKKLSPFLLIALAISIAPQIVLARALIFVQGYGEDGSEWRTRGVTAALVANGWSDGGHLFNNGLAVMMPSQAGEGDHFYTVALPTEAPLLFQLPLLSRYVDAISQRASGEALILVGHSAGGVLARLYMVRNPSSPVEALVTIASPHRGSGISEVGLMVGQTPLSWGLPFIGADSINRSQGLLYDLMREAPGNLLFWLNRQLHPPGRYLSVIRNEWVVAPESQDMRSVAALMRHGGLETIYAGGGHDLTPGDGRILVDFLATINNQPK